MIGPRFDGPDEHTISKRVRRGTPPDRVSHVPLNITLELHTTKGVHEEWDRELLAAYEIIMQETIARLEGTYIAMMGEPK